MPGHDASRYPNVDSQRNGSDHWVYGEEEGLAFQDGFLGKEGLDSRSPGRTGRDSAEVRFKKVQGDR